VLEPGNDYTRTAIPIRSKIFRNIITVKFFLKIYLVQKKISKESKTIVCI
jgi:hypothetical protein